MHGLDWSREIGRLWATGEKKDQEKARGNHKIKSGGFLVVLARQLRRCVYGEFGGNGSISLQEDCSCEWRKSIAGRVGPDGRSLDAISVAITLVIWIREKLVCSYDI